MTRLVAIVNVTPDSFSDGGAHFAPEKAVAAIERFVEEGADIIDIGAESTRPGATPLSPEEEWARLEPVLLSLARFAARPVRFSIDTRHAEVACKALASGAHWINDVSGFADPLMVALAKTSECKLVVMHALTVPADKNVVMAEGDVMPALLNFATARIEALQQAGIARERIIFDPGIGFGKSAAQSLMIIRDVARFKTLGVPILIGHSRKSFLSPWGGGDDATLAVSHYLAEQGVDYLRVHDVARHKQLLSIVKALHE